LGDTLPATGTRDVEAVGAAGERVALTITWRLALQ
jgi:hypothetical protein